MVANLKRGAFLLNEGVDKKDTSADQATASLTTLTISALASHVISIAGPLVTTLAAYQIAALWLCTSASPNPNDLHNAPTTAQYGLLLALLSAPSSGTIGRSLHYAIHRPFCRSSIPPLFLEALAIAFTIWFLTHLVGIADLWLHSTTRSVLVKNYSPLSSDPTNNHVIIFNSSICNTWNTSSLPCLNSDMGWAYEQGHVIRLGWETSHNISTTAFQVVTLHNANDMAIVTPSLIDDPSLASLPIQYTAPTFAARADCRLLNSACQHDQFTGETTYCSQAGYPLLPLATPVNSSIFRGAMFPIHNIANNPLLPQQNTISSHIFGVIDGNVGGTARSVADFPLNASVTNNPATVMAQLRWDTIYGAYSITTTPEAQTNVDTYPPGSITLYAGCNLQYHNVSVRYSPTNNSYTLLNATPSSPEFTSILWPPLLAQYVTGQLMSRACLVGVLYLYALITLAIFFISRAATSYTIRVTQPSGFLAYDEKSSGVQERSSLALAQTWLTDPLPLAASFLSPDDGNEATRSVEEDALDMTNDHGAGVNRLQIGIHDYGGDTVFGVRNRFKDG
ncbi:hypothetical protein FRB99_007785 [Tulasnella sp. 403]|nr:hypothetical protein FRB99_007785 [Tulasnella sp. 403]